MEQDQRKQLTQYEWALWEILRGMESDSAVKIRNGAEHLLAIIDQEPLSKQDVGVAKTILTLMLEW